MTTPPGDATCALVTPKLEVEDTWETNPIILSKNFQSTHMGDLVGEQQTELENRGKYFYLCVYALLQK